MKQQLNRLKCAVIAALTMGYTEFSGNAAGCPVGRARHQSASAVLDRVAA